MFCLRLGRLRRRNLRVSRLGGILGPAHDYPECNSHVGARKNHSTVADVPSDAVSCSSERTQDTDYAIALILRLEYFERFVFVMSVLERYSDQDCSVLLGCSRQDVGETRMRALLHLAEPDRLRAVAPSGYGSSDPEEAQTPEVQLEPQF